MSGIPGRYADQFNLRLPDGMRDRLAEAARANNRSMNAEIVSRLQQSLDGASRIVRGIPLTDEGLEAFRSVAAETRQMVETFKEELLRAEEFVIAREKADADRTRSTPKPD